MSASDLCDDALKATCALLASATCVVCGVASPADEMQQCLVCDAHSHESSPCSGQCACTLERLYRTA
jgi:hypothetical protein